MKWTLGLRNSLDALGLRGISANCFVTLSAIFADVVLPVAGSTFALFFCASLPNICFLLGICSFMKGAVNVMMAYHIALNTLPSLLRTEEGD